MCITDIELFFSSFPSMVDILILTLSFRSSSNLLLKNFQSQSQVNNPEYRLTHFFNHYFLDQYQINLIYLHPSESAIYFVVFQQ